jgi:hypothetical protein
MSMVNLRGGTAAQGEKRQAVFLVLDKTYYL